MNVEQATRRLEIVRLRNLAAWQREEYAASHYRQADHPIYPGQATICVAKARQAERLEAGEDHTVVLAEMEAEWTEAAHRAVMNS